MSDGARQTELFAPVGRRPVEVNVEGGDVTSDVGVLLLRQVDRHLGWLANVAARLPDPRFPERCRHTLLHLRRQRIYRLFQGYEDLNDHTTWRHDLALPTAYERDVPGRPARHSVGWRIGRTGQPSGLFTRRFWRSSWPRFRRRRSP